jgi:phosphoadenosine phosphosulfate reductase
MVVTLDLVHAAERLESAPADEVLRWATVTLPRFAVTSSFGADSAVLLHLVAQVDASLPVLFLDTGFHFPETLAYRRDLERRLGLTDVRDLRPALTVAGQARQHGAGLYLRDPDLCCALRKVKPLADSLAGYDAWATGLRRAETHNRVIAPVVGWDAKKQKVKVSPIARWSDEQVERYVAENHVLVNPLVHDGYPSIGCWPCTRRVAPGEDPRSGRWAGTTKTECGIHA